MIKEILSTQNNEGNHTYHIRNITKGISVKYPEFDELSISKQRRVIMSILENDTHLFEKVGWGLWRLKEVQGFVKSSDSEDYATSSNKEDTVVLNITSNEEKKPFVSMKTFGNKPTGKEANVVRIRRRSSAAGSNDSIVITPTKSANLVENNNTNSFKMPLFNNKERTTSISNTAKKSGVILATNSFANVGGSNKFIQLSKNKSTSYKISNNKYNENALESSDDEEQESRSDEENGAGTDEEDWKSLGAENLLFNSNAANHHVRSNSKSSSVKPHGGIVKTSHSHSNMLRSSFSSNKEENAAMLLIQLRRGSQ
ncbi:hypothetical protein QEN19_001850 [Hanseniaspora menglaensis]